jgi:hypothetical protein
MVRTFGEAYTSLPIRQRGPGSYFMRSFKVAKRSFGEENADSAAFDIDHLYMSAPESTFYDAEEGCVRLPRYVLPSWPWPRLFLDTIIRKQEGMKGQPTAELPTYFPPFDFAHSP